MRNRMVAIAGSLGLMLTTICSGQPSVRVGTPTGVELAAPEDRESFTFVIFGDRTAGDAKGLEVLSDAVSITTSLDPDLVMTIGDMIEGYDNAATWLHETDEYRRIMAGLQVPWFPVAGDHDVYARPHTEAGHLELYQQHFGPLYYSFDHKWAHFVVLFTDESLRFDEPANTQNMSQQQLDWLREDLGSTDAERLFVFVHHPRWLLEYGDNNWDDVHAVLEADGRPTTVFGGHVHHVRDDGQRDNVRYYTVGMTGGQRPDEVSSISMDNLTLVRSRRDGEMVSWLTVEGLRPGSWVSGLDLRELSEFRQHDWVGTSGVAAVSVDAGAASELTVELRNPSDRELAISATFASPGGWAFSPSRFEGHLGPGESLAIPVSAVAPAFDGRRPDIRVLARAAFPINDTQVQSVEGAASVAVTFSGQTESVAAQEPGILKLDGRSAIRLDQDHALAAFTAECWIRGESPRGRRTAFSQSEHLGFALFWSDDRLGGSLPVAHVQTEQYAVTIPAAEPWEWGAWHHVALSYDGQTARFFVNGVLQGSEPLSGVIPASALPLLVGADPNRRGDPVSFFAGAIDDFRLSSVSRYAEGFDPPQRHETDDQTLALLRFDRDEHGTHPNEARDGRNGWNLGSPMIQESDR